MILYHGSSVGWLDRSGLGRTKHPFGEALPPHDFAYLSATRAGADKAASIAHTAAISRIGDETCPLELKHFYFESTLYPPRPTVYIVDIPADILMFDWSTEDLLEKADWERIKKALWHCHCASGCGSQIEYYLRYVKHCFYKNKWKEWVDFVIANYLSGPTADRRVYFFERAGYELIKNLEKDADGQGYGAVYGLVLPRVGNARCKLTLSPTARAVGLTWVACFFITWRYLNR